MQDNLQVRLVQTEYAQQPSGEACADSSASSISQLQLRLWAVLGQQRLQQGKQQRRELAVVLACREPSALRSGAASSQQQGRHITCLLWRKAAAVKLGAWKVPARAQHSQLACSHEQAKSTCQSKVSTPSILVPYGTTNSLA